mgnify:FL=1|jgi:vacuolar-type H+-ATPase subunit I/STV1|tara:strand:- start:1335 stop:1631 length:297 start_codon:yes stop_codon:yes gene_type:complete
MRTLKYFWLKRINLLLGLMLLIPLPTMTLVWLNGGLALHTESQLINKWSNPGFLSAPIAMSIIGFIVGVIVLAFVLTKADIDEVLPLNNEGERKNSKG